MKQIKKYTFFLLILCMCMSGCKKDTGGVPTLIWWQIGSNS
jgi:hypothetical protein